LSIFVQPQKFAVICNVELSEKQQSELLFLTSMTRSSVKSKMNESALPFLAFGFTLVFPEGILQRMSISCGITNQYRGNLQTCQVIFNGKSKARQRDYNLI
jgi:hypothetical protein